MLEFKDIEFCCLDFKFCFELGVIEIRFKYMGKEINVVTELKGTRIFHCPFCGKKIEIETEGDILKI
ncbi:MAG: hypothetical protein ACTSUK_03970 [Promethearchaeota archaeon]